VEVVVINFDLGKLVAPALIVGGVLIFLGIFAYDQRQRGAEKVFTQSKQEGKKINAKNAQVFDRADKPGAADRVLKRFCRDC
jgi:hypothetical protein